MDLTSKSSKPKAGIFLLGSRRFKELGSETDKGSYQKRKERFTEKMLGSISKDIDPVFPGIVYEREDVDKAISEFRGNDVDFVIAVFLSWAEDFAWIRFLRDIGDIPIVFYSPIKNEYNFTDTTDESEFVDFLSAGGLVGALEGSGSIKRLGKKVKVINDSLEGAAPRIKSFGIAAKVKNVLKKSHFGLLASYNELMWSTYVDPYNIFAKLGPEIHFIPYFKLKTEMDEISDSEAENYVEQLKGDYEIFDDFDDVKFVESARASIALARISEKMGLDVLTLNDVDASLFELIGLRPGFYHPDFNAKMRVCVPEGDVGGAFIAYVTKLMTKKHVYFVEPFYIEGEKGVFAAGHAGPNDHTDPNFKQNVKIAKDLRFAKTNYKHAGAPFAWCRIPAGEMTLVHFSECDGEYKIVAAPVESLPGEHFIASYTHSVFKPRVPVNEFFEEILSAGTNQHFVVVPADIMNELRDFAFINNFKLYEIGASK